ncbi:MAG: hypothetical protein GY749_49310 [Desulfobacteraceae bacterium]|nr:hypothetical protein [Desulfobacteraceae bacterium]
MRYKSFIIVATAIFVFFSEAFCYDSYMYQINRYESSSINLEKKYPERYRVLYGKVKDYFSKNEFDAVMSKKTGIEIDETHQKKLIFITSPRSRKMQKQQHKDYVPILVNKKTLAKGKVFFKDYERYLKSAYEKTGVVPGDIIAVLNWESRLGKYRGTYTIFKLFVGQYFYIDELEKELYRKGAYKKKGATLRKKAMKRIKKLKKNALSNLSHLLMQSKNKGFDPFKVKGSWAGAIGIPQFMPKSMKFAGDGDGDGVIDLNTMPDAIMSVASYLMLHEYHEKKKKHAFRSYNPEDMYVRGVMMYSEKIERMGVKPLRGWVYLK